MLLRSQPLDPKVYKKLGLDERSEHEEMTEDNIESQFIGRMFDDILNDDEKVTLKMRIEWKWRDIKGMFYDTKRAIVNCFKWRKTINGHSVEKDDIKALEWYRKAADQGNKNSEA